MWLGAEKRADNAEIVMMCTDIPRANCQAPCNEKEYLKLRQKCGNLCSSVGGSMSHSAALEMQRQTGKYVFERRYCNNTSSHVALL